MGLQNSLNEAEKKARIKDIQIHNGGLSEIEKNNLLENINKTNAVLEEAGFKVVRNKKAPQTKIRFSQIIQTNINYLVEHEYLTMKEESFLLKVSGLIGYQSNGLVKTIDGVQEAMTQEEIAKKIQKSRQNTNQIIKSLIEKGIMARTESGLENNNALAYAYFINPNIMFNGDKKNINETLKLIFKKANKNKILKGLPVKLF